LGGDSLLKWRLSFEGRKGSIATCIEFNGVKELLFLKPQEREKFHKRREKKKNFSSKKKRAL